MSLAQPFRRGLRRAARWFQVRAHPSCRVLESFVRGDLPPRETSRVLQHLVPGCERCRAITASMWEIGTPAETVPAGYDRAFERVVSVARRAMGELQAGRLKAERLAVELDGLPPDQRWALARHDPRYRNRALFELLLLRSRESADDPRRAESLGELAVAVAQSLCAPSRPSLANEDLQAAAWGTLAGARRLLLDFTGAEEALAAAREHLALGTDDRLEKAWLLDLEASLREAQGRAAEASRLRGRAEALYRRLE